MYVSGDARDASLREHTAKQTPPPPPPAPTQPTDPPARTSV